MIAGSVAALRRRIKQIYWSIFLQERKGGGGASYTCASLTSDKRIFQPTRVYRVTFTKAQGCGSMVVVGLWVGGGLGAGGRDGREDEQVGGETESERRGRHGQGFCVTKRQSGQISFYPQCTDSKECVLFPVFPPLFVRREV